MSRFQDAYHLHNFFYDNGSYRHTIKLLDVLLAQARGGNYSQLINELERLDQDFRRAAEELKPYLPG